MYRRQLMKVVRLIERVAAAGVTRAWLRVFVQNHRARRFYEKLDWRNTGRLSGSTVAPHPVLVEYEFDVPPAQFAYGKRQGVRPPGDGSSVTRWTYSWWAVVAFSAGTLFTTRCERAIELLARITHMLPTMA
jgi:hypothetical protein